MSNVQMKTLLESMSMINESQETMDHILNRFKHGVKQFEETGELDEDLYHALYDYYNDQGEMPYGIAKNRTGDSNEWVADRLQAELSGEGASFGHPADEADYNGAGEFPEFGGDDIDGSMEGDFDGEIPESESLSPELDGKEMLDEGLEGTISDILANHGLDDGYDFFFEQGLVAIGRDTAKVIVNALKNDPRITSNPYISGMDGDEVRISFGQRTAKPLASNDAIDSLMQMPGSAEDGLEPMLGENHFAMNNPEMSDDDMSEYWENQQEQAYERAKEERRTPKSKFERDTRGLDQHSDAFVGEEDLEENGNMDGDYSDIINMGSDTQYECPYCGKECPSGIEPTQFSCCGEYGHAQPRQEDEEDYTDWSMRQGEMGNPGRGFGESKEVFEGKVKELSQDLKSEKNGGLSDAAFKKQYKKTKAEMKKTIKESIVVQISAEDTDSFLADIKKLSGLCGSEGGQEAVIAMTPGNASPFSLAQEMATFESKIPVEDAMDEKLANEPNEEYFSLDAMLDQGEDLNRPKKQNAKGGFIGDNPISEQIEVIERKLWNSYEKFVAEGKKKEKEPEGNNSKKRFETDAKRVARIAKEKKQADKKKVEDKKKTDEKAKKAKK